MAMFQKFRLDRRAFVTAALFCLGLVPIVLMMHHVRSSWVPIPFWDEWYTPAKQLESWCRGTLTLGELFSQHNESRKFFPRLLYFALAMTGGWDVRKEMAVFFLEVCLLSVLLWRLLRRTPGSTPIAMLTTWVVMMFLCFSPVQFENFLYGIQLEPFFVGLAVVAVAAVNLSTLSFRSKTLINLLLAFVSTYTFANGMVLWLLAFPLAAPSDSTPGRRRVLWSGIYLLAAAAAIGFFFAGYKRPSYHPELASVQRQGLDLAHYLILWIGSYFASDRVNPLIAGFVAVGLSAVLGAATLILLLRTKEWRTFYPWVLMGAYAVVTGIVTAFGRLGFGIQQALDSRYTVFSLFFYLAFVGGSFALYCAHIRNGSPGRRACFLTHAAWLFALGALCWIWCYQKNLPLLHLQRESRMKLIDALEWMDVIPDNPDLALVFPYVNELKDRARTWRNTEFYACPLSRDHSPTRCASRPLAAMDRRARSKPAYSTTTARYSLPVGPGCLIETSELTVLLSAAKIPPETSSRYVCREPVRDATICVSVSNSRRSRKPAFRGRLIRSIYLPATLRSKDGRLT